MNYTYEYVRSKYISHSIAAYLLNFPPVNLLAYRLILRTFIYLLSCCRLMKCFGAEEKLDFF